MRKLNGATLFFISFVIILSILGLAASLIVFWSDILKTDFLALLLFTFLATVAECYPIVMHYREETNELTVSTSFHFAMIILFAPPVAALSCALGSLVSDTVHKKSWHKKVFNMAEYVISVLAAGYILRMANLSVPLSLPYDLTPLILAAITYYLLNVFLVSTVVALAQGSSLLDIYLVNIRMQMFANVTIFALGILMVLIYEVQPFGLPLLFLPMAAIYFAYKNYVNLQTETKTAIESLAQVIDQRDPHTFKHSERVAYYARELAKALNLREPEIVTLVSAARIHDLGKVGLDKATLEKKEELKSEDWEKIRRHPGLAREIVGNLSVYQKGLEIIAHHHERYDGTGYPDGLKGEAIPLGARILAIADSFDAMTSYRPYRDAQSIRAAIRELKEGAGSQFDPHLVWTFITEVVEKIKVPEPEPQEKEEVANVYPVRITPLHRYRIFARRQA